MGQMLNRRRLYGGRMSYIDWLKSIGCVLYLPLSEQGDLTDHISGNSLVLRDNNAISWDNNANMYIVSQNASASAAYLDSDLLKFSSEYSVFVNFKKISTSGMQRCTTFQLQKISPNYDPMDYVSSCYNGTGNVRRYPNYLTDFSSTYEKSTKTLKLYQEGRLYITQVNENSHNNTFPVLLDGNTHRFLLGAKTSSSSVMTYYLKNVIIFNKALTLEQYRIIAGYDQL